MRTSGEVEVQPERLDPAHEVRKLAGLQLPEVAEYLIGVSTHLFDHVGFGDFAPGVD